jgi:hypothetical protein
VRASLFCCALGIFCRRAGYILLCAGELGDILLGCLGEWVGEWSRFFHIFDAQFANPGVEADEEALEEGFAACGEGFAAVEELVPPALHSGLHGGKCHFGVPGEVADDAD